MGQRAVVVFKREVSGRTFYSSGIYLHWDGSRVRELLETAAPRLRKGDETYAAARFCGICHNDIAGNLSLGIFAPPTKKEARENFPNYSPGDDGVFVVDVNTGEVVNYGAAGDDGVDPFTIMLWEG